MFFDVSSSTCIENTSETKIEVSIEEQGSEEKPDEKLMVNNSVLSLKDPKAYTACDFTTPIVNQFYLNDIFKPPKFS